MGAEPGLDGRQRLEAASTKMRRARVMYRDVPPEEITNRGAVSGRFHVCAHMRIARISVLPS